MICLADLGRGGPVYGYGGNPVIPPGKSTYYRPVTRKNVGQNGLDLGL